MNPARCLAPCTYDPGERLVRIDQRGELAAAGPYRVTADVRAPLRELLAAAATAGHAVTINSAFRSYDEQARLFRSIKQPGRAAHPGQSEHQLGEAVDLRLPGPAAIDWLAAHAADFGFTRSYPPGKQKLTGYRPEPWHVRFVGAAVANELRRRDLTLEELFRERPELGASGTCADCPSEISRKPCGHASASGSCKGPLLTWCFEGALATVDCSAFDQRCGPIEGGGHDCR